MKKLFLALALLIPTLAAAGPDRVSVLAGSKHINSIYEFTEVNPGVFLTWEQTVLDYSVGTYLNSYNEVAIAVSAAYPILRGDNYSFDVFAGVTAYSASGDPLVRSMAGVQGRFGPVFVQYFPTAGKYMDGIVSFGMTFDLN